MKLIIRLTKVSPTHHRFECIREDGTRESSELETKSFLMHDLLHFAYESEAGLAYSFYGLLARGTPYAAMSGEGAMPQDLGQELQYTERIVGPLTNIAKGTATPAHMKAAIEQAFAAYGDAMPVFLTEDFIIRVGEGFRRLWGQWQGTRFGETMEIVYLVV